MENRTVSSPAFRYPYPAALRSPHSRQTGQDPVMGTFQNGNKKAHASLPSSRSANHPDFTFLGLPRFHEQQDAWNSLHMTGLKSQDKVAFRREPKKLSWSDDAHGKDSRENNDGPLIYPGYSDSGYGSKDGSSKQSIISSSCPVESTSSPGMASSQNNYMDEPNNPVYYPASLLDAVGDHLQIDYPIKCSYSDCSWTGKCMSDKKKHEARHRKEFRCEERGCRRKEGFGTINDLERHQKCVHGISPDHGPKKVYVCFGKDCRRGTKKWPRLDNFRQHLRRVHPDENTDALVRKSNEWYESSISRMETANSLVDLSTTSPPPQPSPVPQIHAQGMGGSNLQTPKDSVMAPSQMFVSYANSPPPCEPFTLSPIKNIDTFEVHNSSGYGVNDAPVEATIDQGSVSPSRIRQQPVELPGLRSLNLSPLEASLSTGSVPARSQVPPIAGTGKTLDGVVTNVINAFTRGLKRTTRKQEIYADQGKDHIDDHFKTPTETATPPPHPPPKSETTNTDSLSDSQRKYLSTVLSAVLEQLGGQASAQGFNNPPLSQEAEDATESTKQAGYRCDVCGKMKRLKCELKKHKTRHEKPFGCTFDRCYRSFGSKADWKRHESAQHFHLQSWRCSLPRVKKSGMECAHLYYRQEMFVKHLRKRHRIAENDIVIDEYLAKNRIGRNGQSQYWCGFCRKIMILEHKGLDAWNERFDHIDSQHFKRGQRIRDWVPAKGHRTKKEIRKRAKMKGDPPRAMAAGKEWSAEDSDSDSDINSISSLSSESSSFVGSDDKESSLGLANRSHRNSPPAEGHKTESSEILPVDAGNGSESGDALSLHNPRKRKFSPEPEGYQREPGARQRVKRIKSMPNLSTESDDEGDDDDDYEPHNHSRMTSSYLTTDGWHAAARSRILGTPDYQPSVFCCGCNAGPCNLVLMPCCVDCGHRFCQNCAF